MKKIEKSKEIKIIEKVFEGMDFEIKEFLDGSSGKRWNICTKAPKIRCTEQETKIYGVQERNDVENISQTCIGCRIDLIEDDKIMLFFLYNILCQKKYYINIENAAAALLTDFNKNGMHITQSNSSNSKFWEMKSRYRSIRA